MNQVIFGSSLLICCLFFGIVYSHSCTESTSMQVEMPTSDMTDPRWRMISGMDASGIYSLYSRVREMAQPLLVNTSNVHTAVEDSDIVDGLHSLIDGVCKLVSFYELVSRAQSGSHLHILLTANMEDSCRWLHYLVNNHSGVSSSAAFASLPPTCTPSDTTRLHHYCVQRKIRSEQLRVLIHRVLSDPLQTYYRSTVPAPRPRDWLQSSSLSEEQKNRILDII